MTENEKKRIAENIRQDYTTKEKNCDSFEALVALDKKIKRFPMIGSLFAGILGALVAGLGFSLIMTDLAHIIGITSGFTVGIIIGIIGIVICAVNYPVYNKILTSRKLQFSGDIIKLSDEILK